MSARHGTRGARRPFFFLAPGLAALLFMWLALFAMPRAQAASVPEGFTDTLIAEGFTSPTAMSILPDGRILVIQQDGVIRLIKDDVLLPTPFYTVQNVDAFAERGCLGMVADPNVAANNTFYVYCTVTNGATSHNRLMRVTANGDQVLPGSEQVLLDLPAIPPGTQWHMGGAMRFGIDGMLYVAVGGQEDDRVNPPEASNSQLLSNPFGKILRINPDGSVPADNPFYNTPDAYRAIYSYGLRNPFTFDVQPGTGRIFINDVGAGSWEEINEAAPGANFGWPYVEGNSDDPRFTNAVYQYGHTSDGGCAISGGAFYNPDTPQFPASYVGKFLFADFCAGWIRMLDPADPATILPFASGIPAPVNIGVAPDGSLYYLARNQGTGDPTAGIALVGKISFTNTRTPRITQQPRNRTVFLGDPATFEVAADAVTGIQWQRNGANIPGATGASYTLPATSMADHQARFSAVLTNDFGSVATNPAVLSISTNRLPVAAIDNPATDAGFNVGDTIQFNGRATDAEDGNLPPSAFTWQIEFHHDTHHHPFIPAFSGAASGSFVVPEDFDNHAAANTWYRIHLTVVDSNGQIATAQRDIYPARSIAALTPVGNPMNGLGPIEKDRNNGGAAGGDGGPLMLGNIPYARGLGVHAPSDLSYNLAGACNGAFIADVGIDQAAGNRGSVVFQVFLDNQKAFDSGVMRGGDLRQPVSVSVAGKQTLRLVVTDGGDGNVSDLADWAAARVTRCQGLPPATLPGPGTAPDTTAPPGGSLASPLGGGGGGCSIGGSGRFDPVLPLLVLVSLGWLGWRRHGRRR